ncbi:MAG: discoidin domain-containing protein [Alphaproteobacteria bacterium]|nr:discoidin domain-containing protein [Alphaproteobacteria bacterium]
MTIEADTAAIETNLAIIAMRQLVAEGWAAQGMVDGMVDEFTNASGLDAGASSGMVVTGGYVTGGTYSYADVSAGKTYYTDIGGAPAQSAFNDHDSEWGGTGTNHWVAVDLGTAKTIGRVGLQGSASYNTRNFSAQYSVNSTNGADGTWVTAVSGENPNDTVMHYYTFTPISARWWRIYCVDSYASIGLREAEICEATITAGGGAFTATSAAYAADAIEEAARLVLRHQPIGAVTLGIDLIVEASRDNGATWTAGAPVRQATIGGIDVLTVDIPLSGQPSGLSMRWRVRTTSVEQRLHALSMQW